MNLHPAILESTVEEFAQTLNGVLPFALDIDIDIIDWDRTPKKTVTASEALHHDFEDAQLHFDLMMDYPAETVEILVGNSKVKTVIVNLESKDDVWPLLKMITDSGKLAGISVNPEHSFDDVKEFMQQAGVIQVMTIEPGVQGNPFMEERLELLKQLREHGYTGLLGVDGHINAETITHAISAGANRFSVGSAIVKTENPEESYQQILSKIS